MLPPPLEPEPAPEPEPRLCRGVPTKSQVAIASLLFENSDKIPEGLYKQLMDALLIKD